MNSSRELLQDYEIQFKGKAEFYRSRLLELLPNTKIKADKFMFEHPTNPYGLKEVADTLEQLALEL